MTKLLLFFVAFASGAFAQSSPISAFGTAAALPATCYVSQTYLETDQSPVVYKLCTAANTWTTVGSGGTPSGCAVNQIPVAGASVGSAFTCPGATLTSSTLALGTVNLTTSGTITLSGATSGSGTITAAGTLGTIVLGASTGPILEVGSTNTTTAAGGMYFGGDTTANLFRSNPGALTTNAYINVVANAYGSSAIFVGNSSSSGGSDGINIRAGTTSGDYALLVASQFAAQYMRVYGDGGVSIGTCADPGSAGSGCLTNLTASGTVTLSQSGIGSAQTNSLLSANTTAAANGAQQWNCWEQDGKGWATGSGGSSQTVGFQTCVQPVQGGAASPYGQWNLSLNTNGSYANALQYNSQYGYLEIGYGSAGAATVNTGGTASSWSFGATGTYWQLYDSTASALAIQVFKNGGNVQLNYPLALTAAAPTVAAAQVGFGSTTAVVANCGAIATACLVINVAGTTRYIPYY